MRTNIRLSSTEDSVIYVNDHRVVSFGPRVTKGDLNEEVGFPEPGEATEFIGVYVHNRKGQAEQVVDVATEAEAIHVIKFLVVSWLIDYAKEISVDINVVIKTNKEIVRIIDQLVLPIYGS